MQRYGPHGRAILLILLFSWVMMGCGASSPYYKNGEFPATTTGTIEDFIIQKPVSNN